MNNAPNVIRSVNTLMLKLHEGYTLEVNFKHIWAEYGGFAYADLYNRTYSFDDYRSRFTVTRMAYQAAIKRGLLKELLPVREPQEGETYQLHKYAAKE